MRRAMDENSKTVSMVVGLERLQVSGVQQLTSSLDSGATLPCGNLCSQPLRWGLRP